MSWTYVGLDVKLNVYVYVKDDRYVYVKPASNRVRKSSRDSTRYIGKIEDILTGKILVEFSKSILDKLRFIYEKLIARKAQERREVKTPETTVTVAATGQESDEYVRVRKEHVEFVLEVVRRLRDIVNVLSEALARLLNAGESYRFICRKIREKIEREFRKHLLEMLATWEFDRKIETFTDIVDEAINILDSMLR